VHVRAHGCQTWIVSGGGGVCPWPWSEAVYGIPTQQLVGSRLATRPEPRDGEPAPVKTADLGAIDDEDGKPIHGHRQIGRRPIAAFGNSDGDLRTLQRTAAGAGPRACLLVHHADAMREWNRGRARLDGSGRQQPCGRSRRPADQKIQTSATLTSAS
jgi:hypothetical protein